MATTADSLINSHTSDLGLARIVKVQSATGECFAHWNREAGDERPILQPNRARCREAGPREPAKLARRIEVNIPIRRGNRIAKNGPFVILSHNIRQYMS